LTEALEPAIPQSTDEPALDDQHASLDLGFVARPAWPGWQHGGAVMRRHLGIGSVRERPAGSGRAASKVDSIRRGAVLHSGVNPIARARDTNVSAPGWSGTSIGVRSLLPRDLRFPRGESIADLVGNLFCKRRVGINWPAAEIEGVDIPSQAREASFWKRNFPPSEPLHGIELCRLKLNRRETGRQGLIEPDLDALVEYRIDVAPAKRLQAADVR
jgi:hypothetical protein